MQMGGPSERDRDSAGLDHMGAGERRRRPYLLLLHGGNINWPWKNRGLDLPCIAKAAVGPRRGALSPAGVAAAARPNR